MRPIVRQHMLIFTDMLSEGIAKQYPKVAQTNKAPAVPRRSSKSRRNWMLNPADAPSRRGVIGLTCATATIARS